ncbi:hypothetical protein H4Q26_014357 [Puccinia striiformis f. sp. tritici PST-130]|nr:hypothetical protein H4Q26_014357 [Puccinia striiformis f. sp. tritici PST-130]
MSTPTATPTSTTPASNKRKESLPSSNADSTGTTVDSAVPDLTTTSKHPNKKAATPFDPEDVDIKPDIGPTTAPPTLGSKPEPRSSDDPRHTSVFVQPGTDMVNNGRGTLESQRDLDTVVIMLRALGTGRTEFEKPDLSLQSALEPLNVTPKMIQRCKDHVDWPNEYLIHLSSAHALLLPSFEERTRGICGYALKIDQGQIANPCWTNALCSKVKHNGSKLIGPNTFNGDLTYWVTEIPKGEVPLRLWKNPGSTQIAGMVCGWPICLELLPTCMICGSEDHNGARCSYEDYLISGPSPANEPDDDIMELSPMPTIKHKKKEKKAARIEAPEPEVTHHVSSLSGCGCGTYCPNSSSTSKNILSHLKSIVGLDEVAAASRAYHGTPLATDPVDILHPNNTVNAIVLRHTIRLINLRRVTIYGPNVRKRHQPDA